MVDLRAKPFYLDDAALSWVEATRDSMTLKEKIGQLFCLVAYSSDEGYLAHLARDLHVGGLMMRAMPATDVISTVRTIQENSRIPLLLSANLEAGGDGLSTDGTHLGCHMAVAATGDEGLAHRLGILSGREAASLGVNWAFAPVVDIDLNFRNPITSTRTFGADAARVAAMGSAVVRGLQENGVAACFKHFPGDGVDERDHHLVTTVNTLSCEAWDATFGKVYRACIEAGSLSAMMGHVSQPAQSRRLNPGLRDEEILPGSLSYELATQLLKEELGFNGVVTTDATAMAGMAIPMPRSRAVPSAIAAGCDMFLFARNLEEDLRFMEDGIRDGVLTLERLDEAVLRILAMKAALGLHRRQAEGRLAPDAAAVSTVLGCAEHRVWEKECADRSITLVKREPGVLPLSPTKTKRILLYDLGGGAGFFHADAVEGVPEKMVRRLEREGFVVERFVPPTGFEGMMTSYDQSVDRQDLILYLADLATKSNQTTVRIEWAFPMGANVPVLMTRVPTVFVSLQNPYHLLDVPRVRTYINTYGSTDAILDSLVDKLLGRSPFVGESPVDPFCGKWDATLQ